MFELFIGPCLLAKVAFTQPIVTYLVKLILRHVTSSPKYFDDHCTDNLSVRTNRGCFIREDAVLPLASSNSATTTSRFYQDAKSL